VWAAGEAGLGVVAVLADLLIPSVVLLAMAVVSMGLRRERPSTLGLRRPPVWRTAGVLLALTIGWSMVQLSLTMPIAHHLSGRTQDLGAFDDVPGNAGQLVVFLVLGWTLGALIEEVAYRGYLLTRICEAVGGDRAGPAFAVLVSSVLFGIAHTEQGVVGVLVVTLDGLYFSALRLRFRSLWASILAHGFNNSIGFVAFFVVGPIYGFW